MYAYESKQADNKVQKEKKVPAPSLFNKPTLPPVQMLKSLDEFKEESGLWFAIRQADILAIDNALSTYNTLCTQTDLWIHPEGIPALIISLNAVNQACTDYPQVKTTRRTRNIQPLKNQIVAEMAILTGLRDEKTRLDGFVPQRNYKNPAVKDVAEAARQTNLIRKRYWADYIEKSVTEPLRGQSPMLTQLYQSAHNEIFEIPHHEDIGAFTGSFRHDFQRIANDENAPKELRHVLREALQYASDVPVGTDAVKDATLYKSGKGPGGGRYGINFTMFRSPLKESEGDYLHEMTHILAQKAYHNTPMHLGLPEGSVQADYTALYQHRNANAKALQQLIQQQRTDVGSPFTQSQLKALEDKLKYGAFYNDLLLKYIPGFKNIGMSHKSKQGISKKTGDKIANLTKTSMGGQTPAQGEGGSSIFVEYDAVINQMMMWCYNWGIPAANPVYTKLRQMAEHEHTRRNAARPPRHQRFPSHLRFPDHLRLPRHKRFPRQQRFSHRQHLPDRQRRR